MDTLTASRKFYAQLVTTKAGVTDERIVRAFEEVKREEFLTEGPWAVYIGRDGYVRTPTDNPALLYQDVLVALDEAKGINNGKPSLHALCIDAVTPRPGEAVTHIGCGTGYYTAILVTLVGETGRVAAFEIHPELASQATANLSCLENVTVHNRNAVEDPPPPSDIIYVSAGIARPIASWLDALNPGGRLLFPLIGFNGWGGMLLVTKGRSTTWHAARILCRAAFIPCVGQTPTKATRKLRKAFRRGDHKEVKSLHVGDARPDKSCWFADDGWWLSTEPVADGPQ